LKRSANSSTEWWNNYLGDLKFGKDRSAETLSDTPDYWNVVTRSLKLASTQGAEIIVRDLPLPGHIECCTRPILHRLAGSTNRVKVTIVAYRPVSILSRFRLWKERSVGALSQQPPFLLMLEITRIV